MILPWRWTHRASRLARHVPAQSAGAVLGDLLEEYGERLARCGRWRAEIWVAAELWSLTRAYKRSALAPSRRPAAWLVRPAELTQSLRALARTPWYTLTLAGVIALSMALGATVFAVVDGALFKPLPYRQSDRLFVVALGHAELDEPARAFMQIPEAELREWARELPQVTLTGWPTNRFQVVGVRESVRSAEVDSAFLDVIGVRPAAGGFAAGDFEAVTPIRPALITHDFWRARFAGSPSAIGQTLLDDAGNGIRVAGILPADFVFPRPANRQFVPELLLARAARPSSQPAALTPLVRLGPRVTREEAEAGLTALAARWAADHPAPPLAPGVPERTRVLSRPYDRVELKPIDDELTSGIAERARGIFGVSAALMLLAALNVTSLAITRVRDRWRDLAVRRALGACFADLVRLLAVENAVIVLAGTVGGMAAAWFLLRITLRLIGGAYLVVIKPPAIDARVLVFSALAALACVAIVTLWSARAATRTDWTGRSSTPDGRRRAFITLEVAVALVIAIAGSLLAGSLIRVWREDPGFDVTNAAILTMSAPDASGQDVERLVADIGRLPGVRRAGGAANLILAGALYGSVFDHPAGFAEPPPGGLDIESVAVTHGYLESAGLAPRAGRLLTDAEFADGAPLVVVSESVARSYWPGQNPIGQSLLTRGRPFTVVGVVADARYLSLDREPAGQIYWPTAAASAPHLVTLLIRFDAGTPAPLAATAAGIARLCPTCRIGKADLLIGRLADTIRPRMFNAWLFSTFGVAALIIAGVGVLGLVAMTTNRRTREIGIRMALGATVANVTRQIVSEHLRAVALGLVLGGFAAAYVVRFVEAFLYKTPGYDLRSWAAAIGAILLISIIAALVPSLRASRVDPARVLRVD